MNEILDTVILDNTLRSYLVVAGIIIAAFLLKKYLSRYIAGLLFRLVNRVVKGVDKPHFVDLVVAPLQTFLLILITLLALDKLNFPTGEYEWGGFSFSPNFTLYKLSLRDILEAAGKIILIFSFIWLLLRIIDFVALILGRRADRTPGQDDNQLIVFFKDFFKVVIVINGILMVLKFGFNFNIGSLITGLSIAGAAIALATRESLENLIASFIIFFDRPFSSGDLVKVQQVTGTIEKIGLRSTRIRTDQKTFVTVPNKQMVDNILDNYSERTQRRAFLQLELSGLTPAETVDAFINAVRKDLEKRMDRLLTANVYLADIQKNALIVQIEYFTPAIPIDEFHALRQEINLQTLAQLKSFQIRLAVKEGEAI